MRWFLSLPVLTLLALPVSACAQDQPPQPPTAGTDSGQYQPGALPPEPPVIEPPLPGQADNMEPPPGPDDGQPPMAGQDQPGAGQPGPGQPGDADDMAPPPGGYGGPAYAGAPPHTPHSHDAEMMRKFETRFDTANTTHDGRLTLQQAQDAGLRSVVKHFNQIDIHHDGYVTLNEIMAWKMDQMAQQMERRAAALRAQQGQ